MKRYIPLFEDTSENIIKKALNFADSEPSPANKKAFRFMVYLNDENFDEEEIKQLAVEFYKLHRSKVEYLFRDVKKV
jgi:hypothetical protein